MGARFDIDSRFRRSWLLIWCFLLCSGCPLWSQISLPPFSHISTAGGFWHNAGTWSLNPAFVSQPSLIGDVRLIAAGHRVELKADVNQVHAIVVDGTLVIREDASHLGVHLLLVRPGGKLIMGSPAKPWKGQFTLDILEDANGQSGLLHVDGGGTLVLQGNQGEKQAHSRLGHSLEVGEGRIFLERSPGWQVGDRIVVASTDYDTRQAEEFTITGVRQPAGGSFGVFYDLDRKARFLHFAGPLNSGVRKTMSIAAEVGLLSRNIRIRGALAPSQPGQGGHVRFGSRHTPPHAGYMPIVAQPPHVDLHWVEVTGLGNSHVLGQYPLHFHFNGPTRHARIDGCAIHHNHNRSLVMHQSQGVVVTNNVAYHTFGHSFFLESGLEHNCILRGNLGLSTLRQHPLPGKPLLHPLDDSPATFWITTIKGTKVENNISAGSEGSGFWLENVHESFSVQGMTTTSPAVPGALPNLPDPDGPNAPTWAFNNNVAHSSTLNGYFADQRPYLFGDNPRDHSFLIRNFLAYKCGHYGVFTRTFGHVTWEHMRLADCQVALYSTNTAYATMDGEGVNTFRDVLVIGDSLNAGTPSAWNSIEKQLGRSLPSALGLGVFPQGGLWGLELYDGLVILDDVDFVNFESHMLATQPPVLRRAACITNRNVDIPNIVDPRNSVINATFKGVPMSNRVWFRTPASANANVARMATIWNPDGSLTGLAGASGVPQPTAAAYVVSDRRVMLPDGASKVVANPLPGEAIWRADWNAWIAPDLDPAPGEIGRSLVQVIVNDRDKFFGYEPSPPQPGVSGTPAAVVFRRLSPVPGIEYSSGHFHDTRRKFLSNLYPANLKQGHVYELLPPTAVVSGAMAPWKNVDILVRCGTPGSWLTFKIPVGPGFDPANNPQNDQLAFVTHLRVDLLLFPGNPCLPAVVPPLGPLPSLRPPVLGFPEPFCTDNQPIPFWNPVSPFANVLVTDTSLPSSLFLVVPESTTPPVQAPAPGSPFYGLAWHYDGNQFLYIRVVLFDYGDTSQNPLPAWFLPRGFGAGIDRKYQGGGIRIELRRS